MRESGKISGKRVWEMSGTFLKCVALAAMFADHLLKILLTQPFFMQVCGMSLEASWALLHSPLFYAFELFGRMAFPIFAFRSRRAAATRTAGSGICCGCCLSA